MPPRKVIIDVDVGCDDFFAILILLYGEKTDQIKIEGITCVNGNTSVDYVVRNVVRMLELVGRTDIPIYKGCSESILTHTTKAGLWHGNDGFADLEYDNEPNLNIVQNESAIIAIKNIVDKNTNEISLICLAPLTNIAITSKVFPEFSRKLKDIWIMGGNHHGVGNATSSAEFNFFTDPEAAHIILNSFKCPIYILTWEACLGITIPLSWRFDILGAIKSPAMDLLNRVEKKLYTEDPWLECDALLAACFLDPTIIAERSSHSASIELGGNLTRGQLVLNHIGSEKHNVVIIKSHDEQKFKELLIESAKSAQNS